MDPGRDILVAAPASLAPGAPTTAEHAAMPILFGRAAVGCGMVAMRAPSSTNGAQVAGMVRAGTEVMTRQADTFSSIAGVALKHRATAQAAVLLVSRCEARWRMA